MEMENYFFDDELSEGMLNDNYDEIDFFEEEFTYGPTKNLKKGWREVFAT